MKQVIANKTRNIPNFLIWLLISIISFLTLLLSIANNSIKLSINSNYKTTFISILNKEIIVQNSSFSKKNIRFFPNQRYSTAQYLIEDCGPICNSIKVSNLLLKRTNPSKINYSLSNFVEKTYLIFNPFKSSLTIGDNLKLDLNIPDATIEVWNNGDKEYSSSIVSPWIQLMVNPLMSSFSMSVLLYVMLKLIAKRLKVVKMKSFGHNLLNNKYVPIIIFLFGSLLVGFIFINVFKTMPGFGDEMNYLFQAKIFSSGHIFVKEPSSPEFFRISWMDIFGNDGRLWNFHPFGNSLILLLGQLLNIRWITIPLVGGLILLTQYLLAKELFSNHVIALVHVIIISSSHYFLSLASSYMAHAPSMLFISLFYLYFIKSIKTNDQSKLFPAAVFLGVAFIIRPLSAVLSSFIPLLILLIYFLKRWKSINKKIVIVSGLTGIIIASTIFLYSFIVAGKWDFSYLIKGPEKGQTVELRLKKDLNYKLSNLYRNTNEFQNRIYSFGYFFNFIFFFVPLIGIIKNKKRGLILLGYLILFMYLIIHSLLHWYGWKWEPRMIYDISFVFFLLSTYGLTLTYQIFKHSIFHRSLYISLLLIALFFVIFIDLPYRFKTEYMNYNFNPTGVRDKIKNEKISNAIVFFENEFVFGPYFPENNVTFNGNIIYAVNTNDEHNCVLIKKYPKRKIYYSPDGQLLIRKNTKCN